MTAGSNVSPEFLVALRERIRLSDLVGRSVALKRHGREWTGLCPFHEEKTPSFSVNDEKAIFCCFGCGAKGDAIDFAMRVYRLPFRDAVRNLASENGLAGFTAQIDPAVLLHAEERRKREQDRAHRYRSAASQIWEESLPAANSLVEQYLRSRAITIPIPPSLRFHPELRYKLTDKTWVVLPAMVAAVTDAEGNVLAIHRTFLKRDGSGKAEVPKPKLMLGDARGGGVYLGFIAEDANIVEGIETGLSLQQINGRATIAAGSTGGMKALVLPALPLAVRITIGADNDQNGAGEAAAKTVAARWRDEGREVRITKPREVKDYNDALRLRQTNALCSGPT